MVFAVVIVVLTSRNHTAILFCARVVLTKKTPKKEQKYKEQFTMRWNNARPLTDGEGDKSNRHCKQSNGNSRWRNDVARNRTLARKEGAGSIGRSGRDYLGLDKSALLDQRWEVF